MKRTYFPGITDIVVVTDPAEIRAISNDSRFDRDFIRHGPIRNAQLLRKMLRIFSVNGRLFPTMLPRTNLSRAAAQDELWSRLNVKADEVKHGPAELEPLAEWVRGIGTAEKLDLLVQQSIGRLFVETFTATEESLAAARMVLYPLIASLILAERTHRQARSISYRIAGAKFPVLKDIDKFVFADTPVDEGQVRELTSGAFSTPNATRSSSAVRARARLTFASPWRLRSFAPAPEGVSSISSTSSISSNRKRPPAARADYRRTCCAMISSSSTNSAISRSANPAVSCYSI
jgi:hypothetical protein